MKHAGSMLSDAAHLFAAKLAREKAALDLGRCGRGAAVMAVTSPQTWQLMFELLWGFFVQWGQRRPLRLMDPTHVPSPSPGPDVFSSNKSYLDLRGILPDFPPHGSGALGHNCSGAAGGCLIHGCVPVV